jgi:hypothetical protein
LGRETKIDLGVTVDSQKLLKLIEQSSYLKRNGYQLYPEQKKNTVIFFHDNPIIYLYVETGEGPISSLTYYTLKTTDYGKAQVNHDMTRMVNEELIKKIKK